VVDRARDLVDALLGAGEVRLNFGLVARDERELDALDPQLDRVQRVAGQGVLRGVDRAAAGEEGEAERGDQRWQRTTKERRGGGAMHFASV
jgi:hypothetical protein